MQVKDRNASSENAHRDAPLVDAAEGLQGAAAERAGNSGFFEMGAAVNVLDDDEAHEPLMSGLIFEGSAHQRPHGAFGVQALDVQRAFERAHLSVALFQNGGEQAPLSTK